MPQMDVRFESRGNGAKTNIFNIADVGTSLRTPFEAIMKYLSDQLGAAIDSSTVLKGTHKKDMLEKFLDKYIEKYVLCPKCKYPELSVFLEGKKTLAFRCNACPNTG